MTKVTYRFMVIGVIICVCLAGFVVAAYWFQWDWTGFKGQVGPNVLQYQPEKTLWDWLSLLGVLAIPAVVAFGAAWFTTQQGKASVLSFLHESGLLHKDGTALNLKGAILEGAIFTGAIMPGGKKHS